jgi:tetratricopeptide (TPR) repeat protein
MASKGDDMELTTLALALVFGLGLLSVDSVMHAGSVEVEVAIAPKVENISVDEQTLASRFKDVFDEITATPSVVRPPEIRSRLDQGLGMALFDAVHAQNIAFALQREMGFNPDTVRFALFVENGALQALVAGRSHVVGNFSQVVALNPGEGLMSFVRRCALWGGSQLAPYSTALYLLQQHASDKDFTDVVALVEHAKSLLPPTPTSFDRALLDNILGLVALFRNDPASARKAFNDAMAADPANAAPFLNAAFTDMQFNEYQKAADRMAELIRLAPPANKVLLSTAYMTWGAARMGMRDLAGADRMLAKAIGTNPKSSSALGLWSEAKRLDGDQSAADRLHRQAQESAATFENYAEVAALYFHLSWRDDEPVIRSQFSNPEVVTFH